jgi:hypothetical protein
MIDCFDGPHAAADQESTRDLVGQEVLPEHSNWDIRLDDAGRTKCLKDWRSHWVGVV